MNDKIRVLLVSDTYYPKFDGPVLVMTHYAKNFLDMPDIEAQIAAPRAPDPDNPKADYQDTQPFPVHRCKSWSAQEGYRMGLPNQDAGFKKWLKSEHFDLIHCHSPFTMCNFFGKYGKKHKIPTVFTFHTKFHEDFERLLGKGFRYRVMMRYIKNNINRMDYAAAVSNGSANVLRNYGCRKEITVIRNGADLTYPDNAPALVAEINEKYNLKKDENIFISVGRIVSNKNLVLAFQALKVIADRGHDFKFIIIGDGPEETALQALSKQFGLEDKIIWTGKIMDRQILAAHYLRADLLLLPSMFDTSSLVLLEAAALKLPTVMFENCIPAEVITDQINGFLVRAQNENSNPAEDWADKVIWAITHKEELAQIKENAQKQVYKSWASIASEVADFYKKIVAKYKHKT